MTPSSDQLLVGIFVGGQSSRMGKTKGLLPAPSDGSAAVTTLVERLLFLAEQELRLDAVLVGHRPEYEHLGREALVDKVAGCGPLGGLAALVDHARAQGKSYVIAWACDMPYLSATLARKLAFWPSDALVVSPRWVARYEPLFARYQVGCEGALAQALASGRYGLQPVLARLGVAELPLDTEERRELVDWDRPSDLPGRH